jgi:hypothetical protein
MGFGILWLQPQSPSNTQPTETGSLMFVRIAVRSGSNRALTRWRNPALLCNRLR